MAVLTAAIAVTSGAGTVYSISQATQNATSNDLWSKVSWRAQMYARKAKGGVPDLSWVELWQMTRQRGGFGLEAAIHDGRSLEGSVHNPYVTPDDLRVGAQAFRDHCAACHGSDGSGWHAPALNRPDLKHGDSDLSIYKVVRDGVPGTAMLGAPMSVSMRWQIVGFIRDLQLHSRERQAQTHTGQHGSGSHHTRVNVSAEEVLAAGSRSDEWLTYSGSLDGRRYSPLSQVTPANVSGLRVRWVQQFDSTEPVFEATPLVIDGVIFITEPPSNVVAMDVRTGNVLWRYRRNIPTSVPVCCGRVNRGLAALGNSVYIGTLDGHLVALNANTGAVQWETEVASPSDGYSITGAPLVVNNQIVVGVSGGEFGIRGFLVAYEPATGEQRWKFSTIPGPGEPGHETWQNDAWTSGGGPTWITGSYDPSLDLLYWGVGNPAPDFAGDVRPGDNLYTDSVIALHATTGKLAWHFQFTPHDDHDWDSNQTPILADLVIDGKPRKVICWVNRNGFYYVLDRVTGQFLTGVPFVELNWAKGLDSAGRPVPGDVNELSPTGRLTRPGVGGGTNWQNPAYDERKRLVFVHAIESTSVFTESEEPVRGDRGFFVGSAGSVTEPPIPVVRALDAATGIRQWEHFSPVLTESGPDYSGLLATGAGLIFGASGGSAFALDSATGRELWKVALGGETRAAPITFTIDGQQVIALLAGRSLFVFGL